MHISEEKKTEIAGILIDLLFYFQKRENERKFAFGNVALEHLPDCKLKR